MTAVLTNPMVAIFVASSLQSWFQKLGGLGMILLGLADNSVVPLPGSMDALVIVLTASQPRWWPYYAVMAVIGSLIGGYVTYRLAVAGGKEMLENRIGSRRAEKVYRKFEKGGFASVTIGALLPPPFPIVPVLLAAGALQYSRNRFLAALALGRSIRFTIDALLAVYFGKTILSFFAQYYKPVLYALIALACSSAVVALFYYRRWKKKQRVEIPDRPERRVA